MRTYRRLMTAGLVAFGSAGCGGGDGPPREPVAGVVTLDGRPLAAGMITFSPASGGDPVVTGILGADGRFALDRAEGPVSGPHRVSIWSRQPTGRKVRDRDDPEQLVDETREAVPARYNVATELTAEVRPGGDNTYTFNLDGTPPARRPRR